MNDIDISNNTINSNNTVKFIKNKETISNINDIKEKLKRDNYKIEASQINNNEWYDLLKQKRSDQLYEPGLVKETKIRHKDIFERQSKYNPISQN
jgi:hypothetical protein